MQGLKRRGRENDLLPIPHGLVYAHGPVPNRVLALGGYRMTELSRDEHVWIQSYITIRSRLGYRYEECLEESDRLLSQFQRRFPPSTTPQKESVSGVAQRSKDYPYDFICDECGHGYCSWETCCKNPTKPKPVPAGKPEGVYVTKEMLAKAWFNQLNELSREDFNNFCKELGLSHE